jgi:hypothetical protein
MSDSRIARSALCGGGDQPPDEVARTEILSLPWTLAISRCHRQHRVDPHERGSCSDCAGRRVMLDGGRATDGRDQIG